MSAMVDYRELDSKHLVRDGHRIVLARRYFKRRVMLP